MQSSARSERGGFLGARSLKARLASLALVAALAACGGGGGGDSGGSAPSEPAVGPPATAATLTVSATDAADAAKTAQAAADGMVGRYATMTGFTAMLGVPLAAEPASPAFSLPGKARSAWPEDRAHRLDTSVESCSGFFDPPCTGTVTVDTNIGPLATSVLPGAYVDATFNSVTGYAGGSSITLTGRLRIEFLTSLNLNNPQLPGLGLRLKFVGFGGTVAGSAFGPVSDVADFNFNSQGVVTLTASGARYGTLSGVSVTGAGAYGITSGDVRLAFGSSTSSHVDTHLTNWRSQGGRPVVGSSATLTAGATSATVQVTASSSTQVVYAVTVVTATSSRAFTVTATYPAGGGAPTYSAV